MCHGAGMSKALLFLIYFSALSILSSCASQSVKPVSDLDNIQMGRFSGTFQITNLVTDESAQVSYVALAHIDYGYQMLFMGPLSFPVAQLAKTSTGIDFVLVQEKKHYFSHVPKQVRIPNSQIILDPDIIPMAFFKKAFSKDYRCKQNLEKSVLTCESTTKEVLPTITIAQLDNGPRSVDIVLVGVYKARLLIEEIIEQKVEAKDLRPKISAKYRSLPLM